MDSFPHSQAQHAQPQMHVQHAPCRLTQSMYVPDVPYQVPGGNPVVNNNSQPTHNTTNTTARVTPAKPKARTPKAPKNPPKKRSRNPETWKRNVRSVKHNTGQGKVMKPRCDYKNCKKECSKITEETRQRLFTNFWSTGNYQRQRDYLASMMTVYRDEDDQLRINFHMTAKKLPVCHKTFRNTFSLGQQCLRQLALKVEKADGCMIEPDKRGKSMQKGNLKEEIEEITITDVEPEVEILEPIQDTK